MKNTDIDAIVDAALGTAENFIAFCEEFDRLSRLSNADLVAACLATNAADFTVVQVMMDRLDPFWSKRSDPPAPIKMFPNGDAATPPTATPRQ